MNVYICSYLHVFNSAFSIVCMCMCMDECICGFASAVYCIIINDKCALLREAYDIEKLISYHKRCYMVMLIF